MIGHRLITHLLFALLLASSIQSHAQQLSQQGRILQYHHVSTKTPASTSISPELFRQHMQLLQKGYQVVSLTELINGLQHNQPLPDNAVAITFDDGYLNILQNAHPILQEFDFNYTVFINPAQIGTRHDQLNWSQVKQMKQQGVWFANHTQHHRHLLDKRDMSPPQWRDTVLKEIESAETVLKQQLGYSLKYLAYPYGEFNNELKELLQQRGYIGFGQQSGAVASYSDFGALPRFPAAGIYANPKRLSVKLNSLAFPMALPTIEPELTFGSVPSSVQYQYQSRDIIPRQIACYFKGESIKINATESSLDIAIPPGISTGRSRINCTAPSRKYKGRYYWFSQPFFMPTADGRWLE